MAGYTGTLTGSSTFSGAGFLAGDTADVNMSDKVHIHFTTPTSGTMTSTITLSGIVTAGSETYPFSITENLGTLHFHNDRAQIDFNSTIDGVPVSLTGVAIIHKIGGVVHVHGTVTGGEDISGSLSFAGATHEVAVVGASAADLHSA